MNTLRFVLTGMLSLILLSASTQIHAQELPLSDSAHISLITVTPGDEIYSHYGHTAIRVSDPVRNFDLVFNYGLFDFNTPNFIYRFIKGQTDYVCGAGSFSDFIIEYQLTNRGVTEQILNLKQIEKERIWQALVWNIQLENRTYRYNFFFNNCSTKPRDLITGNLDGNLEYRFKGKFKSLREEIHYFTDIHPWTQFGIDFLIGAQADQPASLADQQFAPTILEESFKDAVIQDDSTGSRPLVLKTRQIVSIDPELTDPTGGTPTPTLVFWLFFVAVAATTTFEWVKKGHFQVLTSILYGLLGLTGSLITFLVLFSEHPATEVNFLLLWQHPFHLIFAVGTIFGVFRQKVAPAYLAVNLFLQIFALAGILFLPQQLHPAMLPLLLALMLRTVLNLRQIRLSASNE